MKYRAVAEVFVGTGPVPVHFG